MTRRTLLVLSAVLISATPAQAQSQKDFSTVRFYPSVGVGTYIGLDGAAVGDHLTTSYGALFDFSSNTLTDNNPCDGIKNVAGNCANQSTNFVHGTGLFHLTPSLT